jgi:hypothetical protein
LDTRDDCRNGLARERYSWFKGRSSQLNPDISSTRADDVRLVRREFGDAVDFALAPGGMALRVRLNMSVNVDEWARRSLQHGTSWYTRLRYSFDTSPSRFRD